MLNFDVKGVDCNIWVSCYIHGLIGVFACGSVRYTRQNKKNFWDFRTVLLFRIVGNYVIKSGTSEKRTSFYHDSAYWGYYFDTVLSPTGDRNTVLLGYRSHAKAVQRSTSFFVIFKTLSIGQAPGIPILQSSAPMTDLFYPARFTILKSVGAAWQGSPSAGPVAILANYKFKSSAVLLNTL